jgi:aminopeptidase
MATHEQLLDRYAELTVKSGLNVRAGQQVLISAPIEAANLVRRITHHAYAVGASLVTTLYNDEQATLMRYKYGHDAAFDAAPPGCSTAWLCSLAKTSTRLPVPTKRDPLLTSPSSA